MTPPMLLILAFLSATFLLGLALGYLLWNVAGKSKEDGFATELQFWKQRWDQSRLETDRANARVEALEKERNTLKGKLKEADA